MRKNIFLKNRIIKRIVAGGVMFALFAAPFSLVLTGCGRKTEVVISAEGEDMTDAAKEYETLEESSAKKFSYDDLTVGAVRYKMTESQVKTLLGEPSIVYDTKETDKTHSEISE